MRCVSRTQTFLALSCVGAISAGPAYAATEPELTGAAAAAVAAAGVAEGDEPPTISVTGQRTRNEREDPRATQELRDTPQTVTVISDQVLRRQNLLTLRDALTTIPGITFGAGEGGGGYGDSIN